MSNLKSITLSKKRRWKEKLLHLCARGATGLCIVFLGSLIGYLSYKAYGVLFRKEIAIDIATTPSLKKSVLSYPSLVNYRNLLGESLGKSLGMAEGPYTEVNHLLSLGAGGVAFKKLKQRFIKDPSSSVPLVLRIWVPASDNVNLFVQERINPALKDGVGLISTTQKEWTKNLVKKGLIRQTKTQGFWHQGDSQTPELAGIKGAFTGSLYIILVILLFAVPLGISSAIYLEELAPKNAYTKFIELGISTLASVPSILFGLLGLIVFLGIFHLPRSSALVGGLTLSLAILSIIIVATQSALRGVPKTLREAALGLGASPIEVAFHHTFPNAVPGIVTGSLVALSRAIGESAPLLMIGMMAFIAEAPESLLDPATVLPVQILIWSRHSQYGFIDNTAAATLVLLLLLGALNLIALGVRHIYEKKSL